MENGALFRIMSDINRRRIVVALHQNEFSVQVLQEILMLGQSTISAHLAQLRGYNFVATRRKGRFTLYRNATTDNEHIKIFIDIVVRLCKKESWYEKDERKIKDFLQKRKELSLSFYHGLDIQNKRSPGQTDFSLFLGVLRSIRDKRIVDIGCGTGRLAKECSLYNISSIGVDIEKKQIDIARKMYVNSKTQKKLKFFVASGENTKLPASSVDIVFFSYSLHHIQEPKHAIREAYRILDKNGVIIILDLRKHNEIWMKDIYGDLHLGFSDGQLYTLLEEKGFGNISVDISVNDTEFQNFESLIMTAQK